jgi:preprotein translocase subunit SecA
MTKKQRPVLTATRSRGEAADLQQLLNEVIALRATASELEALETLQAGREGARAPIAGNKAH